MIVFYGLKTCDTCRKAQKALRTAGKDITAIDVRADGVPAETLRRWITANGWKAVLNTRSTTWRGLSDDEKTGLDAQKAEALLAAHPTLIKRPVIEYAGQILIGWTAETRGALNLE